jgi:hypothetical protein
MRPEDIRKLLGGYATGTLTEEERRALFEAALTDQELFNELNRDQALQELIADPAARRELLRALPEPERPHLGLGWRWAVAGGLAAAALVAIVVVRSSAPLEKPEPVLMAKRQELPAPQPDVRAPQPAAAPAREAAPAKQEAVTVPPASLEPPAEKAATLAAPEAQQVEVTAAATPVETANSEKSALVDAAQSKSIALKGRDMFGYLQLIPGITGTGSAGQGGNQQAADALTLSPTSGIRYKVLRRSAGGGYTEVDPQTVFQAGDRIRVTFESLESGRLQVTSGSAGARRLLNASAKRGGTYNVDVPPEEQKLVVTFSRDQGAAPMTVEIPIRRQSLPR